MFIFRCPCRGNNHRDDCSGNNDGCWNAEANDTTSRNKLRRGCNNFFFAMDASACRYRHGPWSWVVGCGRDVIGCDAGGMRAAAADGVVHPPKLGF